MSKEQKVPSSIICKKINLDGKKVSAFIFVNSCINHSYKVFLFILILLISLNVTMQSSAFLTKKLNCLLLLSDL